MQDIMAKRQAAFPKLPSAGSVFKNLRFSDIAAANPELAKELEQSGLVRDGKVGARALIDRLGVKGRTQGGAKISLEHANFIVNTGRASAGDIAALVDFIKNRVHDEFRVRLETEIQYIGF
jgi:UDP-N-acetylmuramate dehydrogenase